MASSGLLLDIGFSDADVERARLLREYALHQSSPDAERLANLHHAHAALVEAQDGFSSSTLLMPQRSSVRITRTVDRGAQPVFEIAKSYAGHTSMVSRLPFFRPAEPS